MVVVLDVKFYAESALCFPRKEQFTGFEWSKMDQTLYAKMVGSIFDQKQEWVKNNFSKICCGCKFSDAFLQGPFSILWKSDLFGTSTRANLACGDCHLWSDIIVVFFMVTKERSLIAVQNVICLLHADLTRRGEILEVKKLTVVLEYHTWGLFYRILSYLQCIFLIEMALVVWSTIFDENLQDKF